jgi:hypothetical protein
MLADQMLKDAILAWIENAQKKTCKAGFINQLMF